MLEELLAVPQRGMPYVHMGFRIVLYISNLYPSDSLEFLPMIEYMRWSRNPSCFILVNMCFKHKINNDCIASMPVMANKLMASDFF